jgi:hypothetical protein
MDGDQCVWVVNTNKDKASHGRTSCHICTINSVAIHVYMHPNTVDRSRCGTRYAYMDFTFRRRPPDAEAVAGVAGTARRRANGSNKAKQSERGLQTTETPCHPSPIGDPSLSPNPDSPTRLRMGPMAHSSSTRCSACRSRSTSSSTSPSGMPSLRSSRSLHRTISCAPADPHPGQWRDHRQRV